MTVYARIGQAAEIAIRPATTGPSLIRSAALARRVARHWPALVLLCLSALPLLWPSLPPLVDVPNHLSRYRIALDYNSSPLFRSWFEVHHVLVGNLGMDLLVAAIAPWLGLELSVKLLIIAIPVCGTLGVILISREVHGRITALTPLAAALVYNYPFNFGFLNYSLSMSLALLAFWLWLHLERLGRTRLRAALFVPIGFLVWLSHASGWGVLGLMVFGWELASAREENAGWPAAARRALLACLPLALPALPMLLWSAHTHSLAVAPPHPITRKITVFFVMLSDAYRPVDIAAAFMLVVVALLPIVRSELRYDRRLLTVGSIMLAAFIVMPPNVIGSSHADMRIAPYVMMLMLLGLTSSAITPFMRKLGIFAWLFFAAQMLYHFGNNLLIAKAQQHQLEALAHIPPSTTVFALANVTCGGDLSGDRMHHLHRMATVRRGDFTNSSWGYPSTQTVLPRAHMTAGYIDEGSALMEPADCRDRPTHAVDAALHVLPRERYRYLWILDMPPSRWPVRPWLHRIWSNDLGALYRIDPPIAR